jgi:DHA1 family tetracycline resistance protein-like MFS transporter
LQGANSSLMGIANMIGPVVFAQSFAFAIGAGAPLHLPGTPFLLSALMLIAAIVVAIRTTRGGKGAPIASDQK